MLLPTRQVAYQKSPQPSFASFNHSNYNRHKCKITNTLCYDSGVVPLLSKLNGPSVCPNNQIIEVHTFKYRTWVGTQERRLGNKTSVWQLYDKFNQFIVSCSGTLKEEIAM